MKNGKGKWKILRIIAGFVFVSIAVSIDMGRITADKTFDMSITGFIRLFLSEVSPLSIEKTIFMAFFAGLVWKREKNSNRKYPGTEILAAVFSFSIVLGRSFARFHDFTFLSYNHFLQLPVFLAVLLGYWFLFFYLLDSLFTLADKTIKIPKSIAPDHKIMLSSWAVIMTCWIILAIPFIPGSIPFDGRYQLNMYYGGLSLADNHPVFSTWTLGLLHQAGTALFGEHYGMFLITFIQMALGSFVFSRICTLIWAKAGNTAFAISLCFYILPPMWWTYAQTLMKDTLYYVFFSAFTYNVVLLFYHEEKEYSYAELLLFGFLLSQFRKNGILVVVPSLIGLFAFIFRDRNRRKKICIISAVYLLLHIGLSVFIAHDPSIRKANPLEAFSVPLQQVARYVSKHESEITDEEKEIIDHVIVYENIPRLYDPEFADRIKDRYRPEMNASDKEKFVRLYLTFFTRDPVCFIEALGNHVFGYMDPEYFYQGMTPYQLYTKESITNYYISNVLNEKDPGTVYQEYIAPDEWRDMSTQLARNWNNIPVLSFLVNPAAYSWMLLLSIAYVLQKKQTSKLLIYLVPCLNILTCFFCPVNGLLRYMLPTMAAMPLYLTVSAIPAKQE